MLKWTWVLVALVACNNKAEAPAKTPPAGSGSAAAGKLDDAPRPKIDGPAVTPVTTESIAFVVPKDASWWGEFNMACYRAAMSLTGTRSAADAFNQMSPNMPAAMRAGEIDIGEDLAAVGMFECADSPCIYLAATLNKPEKMPKVLEVLMPGLPIKDLGKGHYTVETPGMRGTRTIHVRVVPIQWTGKAPAADWARQQWRATHVVFLIGVDGKNLDIDPLAGLADPQTALASVKDAEGVLPDARDRCLLGGVTARDFMPGFKLDRARFALGAPPAPKADPLMQLLASKRTLDFEVELVLAPAAKPADVTKWVAQGRQWFAAIGGQVRGSFAANPLIEVYFDMIALVGERGFKNELAGKSLRFSWRTDRIPASDIEALEKGFNTLLADP